MILSTTLPTGLRFRGLLLILLLALGLLASVTLSQSREAEQHQKAVSEVLLPAMKQLRELSAAVDESRGLLALHLLLRKADERAHIEQRLQAARIGIDRRMVAHGRELIDDADRRHHAAVQASLLSYWRINDQLLAVSRQAVTDSAAADAARELMQGDSQLAFAQLRVDIETWWQHSERAAAASARLASAAARWAWTMALAGLALGSLPLPWLLSVLASGQLRAGSDQGQAAAGADQADGAAAQLPLDALSAAVAAARRGEPGLAGDQPLQQVRQAAGLIKPAAEGAQSLRALEQRDADGAAHQPAREEAR